MKSSYRSALIIFATALAFLVFILLFRPPATELVFLSVGQGDCILFRHQGVNILIDAAQESGTFDAGERIVARKLRDLGVDHVDMVFLSHPDSDHIGGLSGLRRKIAVRKVLALNHFRQSNALLRELHESKVDPTKVVWLLGDEEIRVGDFTLEIGAPDYHPSQEDNEGSMFIRIVGQGAAAVFSGDAGSDVERQMIGRKHWRASLMKAGHHGSAGATSDEWLAAVSPDFVVYSCGRDNNFGHPSAETRGRVQRRQIMELRTDRDGDLHFRIGPHGFELVD